MEKYNPENVELVDFDTLQEMLKKEAVYSLIGFTKAGKMLLAGKDVKDMRLIPEGDIPEGEKDLPLSGMSVLAYTSALTCCKDGLKHAPPVRFPSGWFCQNLKEPCDPGEVPCGHCTSF